MFTIGFMANLGSLIRDLFQPLEKSDIISDFADIVKSIRIDFLDIIDILAVSVLFYFAYKFIRNKRAGKLFAGVLLVLVTMLIGQIFGMHAIQFIFKNFFQVGVIALVILFQPELRSALEKMGDTPIQGLKNITERGADAGVLTVREVATAAQELSQTKTGALIVCERSTKLGEVISTGSVIDAQIGSMLIRNIFFNKAPLHDGALVVSGGRLHAAGCLLPLSAQTDINKDLGTRHRAALGLSENSDAVVVVVSEETGVISVAVDGVLTRGYNADTLRLRLTELLVQESDKDQLKSLKQTRKKKSRSKVVKEADNNEKSE